MATKFQDNTIIFLGGQATYGPNRSQELADEMTDGWGPLMTHFFDRPDSTAAFLERATPFKKCSGIHEMDGMQRVLDVFL